ncbi:hypothetical protein KSP40_PGU008245 [Platanthera guangdongensis]|uniref:C3H1-type domain-containing protein n=1 Tax=Platanthera guangdongensis TaxID=2320717 RepID=A0ABR2MCE3_9ASPA
MAYRFAGFRTFRTNSELPRSEETEQWWKNYVFQLKVDGVAFRLIPDPDQVLNATKFKLTQLHSRLWCLSNFKELMFLEDLEDSLLKASKAQGQLNPSLRKGNIEMRVGMGESMIIGSYPEHPGEPDCTYYLRTGLCRYGITCRFNHPPNRNLNFGMFGAWGWQEAMTWMKGGYPERVGLPDCQDCCNSGGKVTKYCSSMGGSHKCAGA